jgi:hypothetical protein
MVPTNNETEAFTEFTPTEVGAMRFAYRQMREAFPDRIIGEIEQHELAISILEGLGRSVTKAGEEKVIDLLMRN